MNLELIEAELQTAFKTVRRRIICVDLDGTLAEYDKWRGFLHVGKPRKAVVDYVRAEAATGTKIIIHTCRTTTASNKVIPQSLDAVAKWLKKHKVPYDEIWTGTGKPYANVYLDDKAMNVECRECHARVAHDLKKKSENK